MNKIQGCVLHESGVACRDDVHAAGSARTVNRRYIADFTPKAQRTKASAGEHAQVTLQTLYGLEALCSCST